MNFNFKIIKLHTSKYLFIVKSEISELQIKWKRWKFRKDLNFTKIIKIFCKESHLITINKNYNKLVTIYIKKDVIKYIVY